MRTASVSPPPLLNRTRWLLRRGLLFRLSVVAYFAPRAGLAYTWLRCWYRFPWRSANISWTAASSFNPASSSVAGEDDLLAVPALDACSAPWVHRARCSLGFLTCPPRDFCVVFCLWVVVVGSALGCCRSRAYRFAPFVHTEGQYLDQPALQDIGNTCFFGCGGREGSQVTSRGYPPPSHVQRGSWLPYDDRDRTRPTVPARRVSAARCSSRA